MSWVAPGWVCPEAVVKVSPMLPAPRDGWCGIHLQGAHSQGRRPQCLVSTPLLRTWQLSLSSTSPPRPRTRQAGAPLVTCPQKSHPVMSSLCVCFHFLEQMPPSSPRARAGAFGSLFRGTPKGCVPILESLRCEWLRWDSSLSRHGSQAGGPSSSPPPPGLTSHGGRAHWGK